MSIATEVTYVDGVTTVAAAWLNLIQEHLAGWVNLQVTVDGQVVTIGAAADSAAASVYIGGQQRLNETDITFTFTGAEATDTFDVYVVGDGATDAFTMEVVSGAPVGTNTRKVAEVDYDTTLDVITDLRVERGRFEEHDHSANSGAPSAPDHSTVDNPEVGDPHTQYMLPDGSRPFTGVQVGVDPAASSDIATKGFADGLVSLGAPVGTTIAYGGTSAPSGWLLCDGTSYLVATYPILAALLNDAYGGDGGTNFNVPDMAGMFAWGRADAGTGSSIGDTGGTLEHSHTQPTHTHDEASHSHGMTAHTHTTTQAQQAGAHTHSQLKTGKFGSHTHVGLLHDHNNGSLVISATGSAIVGARLGSVTSPGLYPENDLDTASDNSSHSHGDGSYVAGFAPLAVADVSGSTSSNTASHTHVPSGNSYAHTHAVSSITGRTANAGGAAGGSAGNHTHNNPTTSENGGHNHNQGATDAALTSTQAQTPGTTSADGDEAYSTEAPGWVAVQFIVKHD